ncbi:MAG: DEAD/DEAH box helicase [Planctomycetota bacterium]|nr:DEAD/DEAH box helicase [Planctomycetota bacterium]
MAPVEVTAEVAVVEIESSVAPAAEVVVPIPVQPAAVVKAAVVVAEAPVVEAPVVVAWKPAFPAAETIAEENGFRQLKLIVPLMKAIEDSGYTTPTPIQAQTITHLLEGRDVLGQAQTGSGKTGAFALPMLQRIDLNLRRPQVLVLVPTRELAIQVAAAFERYGANMSGLNVLAVYGGAPYQPQFAQMKRGVHVIVGTPGRITDHMNRGSLQLDALKGVVLDEGDEMLRMGFAESVEWILDQLPVERQIALFSATMPPVIRKIAQKHLKNPAEITIRQKTATADTIRQRFVVVGNHQKEAALGRILEAEPIDGVIVFVKMRSTTEPLADFLSQRGHRVAALNGDIAQAQRERIIEHLKAGKLDIIVATDVAARGLDVQRISHVINYDLPGDNEAYVHRIGRTGRAGRSGEAILFVHPKAQRMLKSLEYATRQKIEPMDLPTNRAINKMRVSQFHAKITETMTNPLAESMGSLIEQYRRENPETPVEQIMAALAVMSSGGQSLLLKEEFRQETFFESRGRRDERGPGSDRGPRFGDRGSRFDDRGSRDRAPRSEGSFRDRDDRPRAPRRDDANKETFRIEVGHMHQVKPGNIVGAIANEAGIDSAQIGRIEIFDDFSTVDLPQGMPPETFFALKKVWVSGRQLQISKAEGNREQSYAPRPGKSGGRPDRPNGGGGHPQRKPRREGARS